MRSNVYIWFAFFASVAAVGIAGLVVLLAVSYTASPKDFAAYAYSEYIDRSGDMTFAADGGAQLYEAESASLSSGASSEDNAIASGGKAVRGTMRGSVIRYTVAADGDCSARFYLSVCHLSENGENAGADELFSLRVNGAETGERGASVSVCASAYEFKENALCTVELKTGRNEVEIVMEMTGVSVDYMVLVSERRRTSSDPVIGVPSCPFLSAGDAQRFETEHAEKNGATAYYDRTSSCGFFTRFSEEGADVVFYPESDGVCTATLALALRNTGFDAYLSAFCSVYVNGMETFVYPVRFPSSLPSDDFTVAAVASVTLGKGVNAVRIVNKSGAFDLDYAELNYGVTYSPYKSALRYEAESAFLSGGCAVKADNGASCGYGVVYTASGSNALFFLRSLSDSDAYLSVRIRRDGDAIPLSDALTVSVNGMKIRADGTLSGGGQYTDVFIGRISLSEGDNVLEIESAVGYAGTLDFVTLSHADYAGNGVYEAENAALIGCQSERNAEASGGMNVGYLASGDSVNFYLMADAAYSVRLVLSLSSNASDEILLSDYMKITVNGTTFGMRNAQFPAAGRRTEFKEIDVGTVTLSEGLNVVSVICLSKGFSLDYIRLA